jgi:hypothetical protein
LPGGNPIRSNGNAASRFQFTSDVPNMQNSVTTGTVGVDRIVNTSSANWSSTSLDLVTSNTNDTPGALNASSMGIEIKQNQIVFNGAGTTASATLPARNTRMTIDNNGSTISVPLTLSNGLVLSFSANSGNRTLTQTDNTFQRLNYSGNNVTYTLPVLANGTQFWFNPFTSNSSFTCTLNTGSTAIGMETYYDGVRSVIPNTMGGTIPPAVNITVGYIYQCVYFSNTTAWLIIRHGTDKNGVIGSLTVTQNLIVQGTGTNSIAGQLNLTTAGSAAAPSLLFNDTTSPSGLWGTDNNIFIGTGGADRLNINNSGLTITSGNIFYPQDNGFRWNDNVFVTATNIASNNCSMNFFCSNEATNKSRLRLDRFFVGIDFVPLNLSMAGTAANPALIFNDNFSSLSDRSGLYGPADNQIGISTGGSQRVLVDNSGVSITGNLTVTGTISGSISTPQVAKKTVVIAAGSTAAYVYDSGNTGPATTLISNSIQSTKNITLGNMGQSYDGFEFEFMLTGDLNNFGVAVTLSLAGSFVKVRSGAIGVDGSTAGQVHTFSRPMNEFRITGVFVWNNGTNPYWVVIDRGVYKQRATNTKFNGLVGGVAGDFVVDRNTPEEVLLTRENATTVAFKNLVTQGGSQEDYDGFTFYIATSSTLSGKVNFKNDTSVDLRINATSGQTIISAASNFDVVNAGQSVYRYWKCIFRDRIAGGHAWHLYELC